jgi:hypothetical protein
VAARAASAAVGCGRSNGGGPSGAAPADLTASAEALLLPLLLLLLLRLLLLVSPPLLLLLLLVGHSPCTGSSGGLGALSALGAPCSRLCESSSM